MVASPLAAAPSDGTLAGFDCQALLDTGGFDSRFRVIDPLTRVTACRMKGVVEGDVFQLLLGRRIELWLQHCFSARERTYLRGMLRQGSMQTLPFVTRENCASSLDRLLALPDTTTR